MDEKEFNVLGCSLLSESVSHHPLSYACIGGAEFVAADFLWLDALSVARHHLFLRMALFLFPPWSEISLWKKRNEGHRFYDGDTFLQVSSSVKTRTHTDTHTCTDTHIHTLAQSQHASFSFCKPKKFLRF